MQNEIPSLFFPFYYNRVMNTNNQAFPNEAKRNVFATLAEKMGNIRVIYVARKEYGFSTLVSAFRTKFPKEHRNGFRS
jgi:hypothetical protein